MKTQSAASVPGNGHHASLIIAIDGPAGAGKSTVAKLLAAHLGYLYLDTGALYRALAWKVKECGCDPRDREGIERLLADTALDVSHGPDGGMTVVVDGRDVTTTLRAPEVSELASAISALPAVREWLLPIQRRIGVRGAVVAEGRDIGTRVFPAADVKFYLEANTEVRARRRYQELLAAGRTVSLTETQNDLVARDLRDETRAHAPLRRAEDAITIDTSALDASVVLDHMLAVIATKL
ncbi:cytidylate kinase [Nitrospira sp.]|nr:cytidylate kinase [Nitrospira sp.]